MWEAVMYTWLIQDQLYLMFRRCNSTPFGLRLTGIYANTEVVVCGVMYSSINTAAGLQQHALEASCALVYLQGTCGAVVCGCNVANPTTVVIIRELCLRFVHIRNTMSYKNSERAANKMDIVSITLIAADAKHTDILQYTPE